MQGLLLASATLEAAAGIIDISAYAGRAAAHAALGQHGGAVVPNAPASPTPA
jgi:hypothetical protein